MPADVPENKHKTFIDNYRIITHESDRLFLFACDQKIEHLHDDFDPINRDISPEAIDPEHFFKIASQGRIGALATQLELIARYGSNYSKIPYIAKLNGKTNLLRDDSAPFSAPLWTVQDVLQLNQEANFSIAGIGVTIYPGSAYEAEMMSFAAQMIIDAHTHGLIAIIWMYPKGATIANDLDPHLLAGVAGAANALGADFVKIKAPTLAKNHPEPSLLKQVVVAAGNTKVICSGGSHKQPQEFLKELHDQLHIGGTAGAAVGRNIFQYNLAQAVAMTQAIIALIYDNKSVEHALKFIKK